jgi:hypothetical protein
VARARPHPRFARKSHLADLSKNVDFNSLIPEMRDWNNGKGIDIDSWIQCVANHKVLIGCSQILWPNFFEHDGCIFLGDSVDETNYQAFLERFNGDKKSVEEIMNHQHVLHLFATELPTRGLVLYVGRLMKQIWQVKLSHDFPGRRIAVSFPEEEDLELDDYEITFSQER